MTNPKDSNLIWIDLEMTGLDTCYDSIIEIATIVTDSHLNILAEGPVVAIHQSEEILDGMDHWNQRQHGKSGLVNRVKNSVYNEKYAEEETLAFLKQHINEGMSPMCGNSICQDRRFLARCMPKLESYFHYRHIDVSTIKELAVRWVPGLTKSYMKKPKHLALEDIKDSIEELKYYRERFFVIP